MLREVGKKEAADAYRFLGTQRYSSSSYGASLCYRALSGTRAAMFSKEEITWIQKTISLLREWAKTYNTESFIKDDPVRFPHRFTEKQDIEISAFLTAWISYGRRGAYSPKSGRATLADGRKSLRVYPYRRDFFRSPTEPPGSWAGYLSPFYTYHDLHLLCCRLKDIYDTYDCMEDAMAAAGPCEDPILRLRQLFADLNGIPVLHGTSACSVWRCSCVGWCVRMVSSISVSGERPCIPAN